MASMWPPKKNTAFTLSFTLYKNDGTVVTNPGTYTKKVSIDGTDVADIAASVTEENTTYGQLSLVIASGEMNGDWIWVYITDDTEGTVPFTCTLYPTANTQDEIGTVVTTIAADAAAILVDTGTDGVVVAAASKTGYALSAAGVDAILDDAPAAELSSVPTTTGTLRQMVQYLFSYFRNKKTVTATTETLCKEDASTALGTATVSDDGTTFTKGEMG